VTRSTLTTRLLKIALGAATIVAVAAPATAAPPVAAPSAPAPNPAAAKPGQPGPSPVSARDAALLERQDALLPAARILSGQARAAGSDISGVRLDVPAGVIHVYRTAPAESLRLPADAAGTQVVVHQAKFSRTEMVQAAERVTHDAKVLGEQKVSVQAVGPSVDGSGIVVSVLIRDAHADVDLSRASAVLRARYGTDFGQVTGVRRQTSDKDLFFAGWRFNDYAPWYGGDRIRSSTGGGCSTGFAASYNGSPVMLTAAHCGGVGMGFYNGPHSDGFSSSYMGSSAYSDAATDIGAISVSSNTQYINVGPAENSGLLYVGSWASPLVGQYLCQSGSYTGEVCALRVVDTGQYVCRSWFLWYCTSWQGPLADVINAAGSGSYAAGHGDSGGPVYLRSWTSGSAMGLVHGVLTPNAQAAYPAYFPDTMWCPAPEGWSQRCASGFSFAHMPGY
jgi:hypothetical protein